MLVLYHAIFTELVELPDWAYLSSEPRLENV